MQESNIIDREKGIHAAWAADEKYGAYAGISMASVINKNLDQPVHLHLFSDGVHQRDISKMKKMAEDARGSLSVYDIRKRLDDTGRQQKFHYSRATYGRLFIPEMISLNVEKVMYFDCDVICVDSLRDLWQSREQIDCLAAVRDIWIDQDIAYKKKIGIPSDSPYFNCGVLLISLPAWRERGISTDIIKFVSEREATTYVDQDAINFLIGKEITEVPRRWNVLATSPEAEGVVGALEKAANIHFCGALKPWHLGYSILGGVAVEAFRSAKRGSPWRRMLPDPQFARVRRKVGEIIKERRQATGSTPGVGL